MGWSTSLEFYGNKAAFKNHEHLGIQAQKSLQSFWSENFPDDSVKILLANIQMWPGHQPINYKPSSSKCTFEYYDRFCVYMIILLSGSWQVNSQKHEKRLTLINANHLWVTKAELQSNSQRANSKITKTFCSGHSFVFNRVQMISSIVRLCAFVIKTPEGGRWKHLGESSSDCSLVLLNY